MKPFFLLPFAMMASCVGADEHVRRGRNLKDHYHEDRHGRHGRHGGHHTEHREYDDYDYRDYDFLEDRANCIKPGMNCVPGRSTCCGSNECRSSASPGEGIAARNVCAPPSVDTKCSYTLPQFVYRLDERPPETIAGSGFLPWKATGTITLIEHVNNVLEGTTTLAKHHSQWVSFADYGFLKKLDMKFLSSILSKNVYKIDTRAVTGAQKFVNANLFFQEMGEKSPYQDQCEWAREGGAPASAVVAYMTGREYLDQCNGEFVAPDETDLQNWHPLP